MTLVEGIKEATIAGKGDKVQELARQALDDGISLDELINNGFIAAMAVVGERFSQGEIFVPEMLVAARAMKLGLAVLEPVVKTTQRKYLGRVVIGTVQGDLHDIGKNLVIMMLQGSGYEVIDLGIDVKPEQFVAAVREHQPDVLGMAALLTTTMKFMTDSVAALEAAGLRQQVKVIVGGAPVTPQFAKQIGADRYVPDAGEAIDIMRQLLA
ncbi:MAG: corrinoid protein [Negativicutes bacterium]|nr:corrinoid protein [Negativicutes bacterium]MDR3591192.1 corrinoid protein [Negativicutes bacterium]